MTNYEKIKNMSVEEMAAEIERISNYLCDYYGCPECPFRTFSDGSGCTKNDFLYRLNSEVEE